MLNWLFLVTLVDWYFIPNRTKTIGTVGAKAMGYIGIS